MSRKKIHTSQKGFAVLETLLILIVVGVIAGTSWYAWHSKGQTDKILAQADKSSLGVPAKKASTPKIQNTIVNGYLPVKEWGVKIPSSDIPGLGYTFSAQNNAANFASKALTDLSAQCSYSPISNVTVIRGLATDIVPNETNESDPSFQFANIYNELIKNNSAQTEGGTVSLAAKVGNYYFLSDVTADYSCTVLKTGKTSDTDTEFTAARTTAQQAIVKAINSMVAE